MPKRTQTVGDNTNKQQRWSFEERSHPSTSCSATTSLTSISLLMTYFTQNYTLKRMLKRTL